MAFGESIFDLVYLISVVGLGINLVLQKSKSARQFGVMGIILGLGDSFHLMPRIISWWSEGGFEANAAALSYGKLITSISMTIFYLLYYFFYKSQTGEKSRVKDVIIYVLVLNRIILTVLPQNEWGTLPGNYAFSLIRNIPFAILGLLLIIWSAQHRDKKGLKNMALLISLSFLFYAPVVVGVNYIPALGALMIPKTIAYFLIVLLGYKRFMPEFSNRSIAEMSFMYLVLGLAAGVFYREFSKLYNFNLDTTMSTIHVHVLVLGFIGMLVIFVISLLLKNKNPDLPSKLKKTLVLWHIGLLITVSILILRGFFDFLGTSSPSGLDAAISGIAGLGHIVLAAGMVLTSWKIIRAEL